MDNTTIDVNVTIDVDKLIEGLPHEKRAEIFATLFKSSIACAQLDKATNTWCLILCGKVPAKMQGTIVTRSPIRMTSPKLVILEPSFERIEHETIVEMTDAKLQTTKTWWGGGGVSILEPAKTIHRIIEHKSIITVPRSIWRLRGAFVGADCVMPLNASMPGDLFGPNSDMRFQAPCEAGLDVTLSIENTTEQEMPFHAAILGIQEERKHEPFYTSDPYPRNA